MIASSETGEKHTRTSEEDKHMNKGDYRKKLLRIRSAVGGERRAALTHALADAIEKLSPKSVGLYWPIRGEPDCRDVLIGWQTLSGGVLCLPETQSESMIYRRWDIGMVMSLDIAGIPYPPGEEMQPEVIIAPCVGYSESGRRLGYGGGYFDKYLSQCRTRPRVIGLAFDEMRVPESLFQSFDQPLDAVVTDCRVIGTLVKKKAAV